jgi:sortase (surface protein transpeptidase)
VAAVLVGLASVATATGLIVATPGRALPPTFGAVTPVIAPAPSDGLKVVPTTPAAAPRSASLSTPAMTTVPSGLPTRVSIPRLNISAVVVPTGTDDHGVAVPTNPATTGWWVGSAPAGSDNGATVLVGHVDSAATGPGALYRVGLGFVHNGYAIDVSTATGVVAYRVYAQHVYHKTTGIPAAAFAATGPARLVLITCGGPFDRTTQSYRDNIVIYAAPA